MHKTDIVVIGAGPVGLFAVFQAGMLKMRCHVVDALNIIGGQCAALYPEKPIYDIPAYPVVESQELINKLAEQAAPFSPTYHLGQKVEAITKRDDVYVVTTNHDVEIEAKAVIIAAGCGAFGPNRPPLANIEEYENKSVFYMVNKKDQYVGKRIAIAGGGDSAIDWALSLGPKAEKIYLVHRRDKFRCAPHSLDQLNELIEQGKVDLVTPYQLKELKGEKGHLKELIVSDLNNNQKSLPVDYLLAFFGLAMEIGPIADWGLDLSKNHIRVQASTCQTNLPGVYAIGDICFYEGKLKLILTGFAEAASAAHSIYNLIYPNKVMHFEYSTTKGVTHI